MQLKDFTIKGRGGSNYDSKLDYIDGNYIIKKGSIIKNSVAETTTYKQSKKMCSLRTNRNYVSSDFVVLKDITFKSASSAAEFVCGYSINGLIRWKKGKITLKEALEEAKNE